MGDPTERIREMVREAIAENPKVKNQELLDRARAIAPEAVEGMTIRQFHGTYRLPVARAASAAKPKARKPKEKKQRAPRKSGGQRVRTAVPTAARDAVRDVFRRFAMELSAAEGRGDIVRVVARIDDYAEEAMRHMQGPDGPGGRKAEVAADAPPAESTAVADPPAEERKRRRRPKAEVEKAAALRAAAEVEAPAEPAAPAPPPEPQPDAKKASPLAGLVDDLEAFRRRQSAGQRRHL